MTDTLSFITGKAWDVDEPGNQTRTERTERLQKLLETYHSPETATSNKHTLKEKILREVYYFFPFFLKRHSLPKELFDEAMQNMVLHAYEAIDKFDCSWGTPFPVYVRKYLTAAISEAKQQSKVIKTPISVRQKTLDNLARQAEEADDVDKALNAHNRYAELTPTYVHADDAAETNTDAFYEKCESCFYEEQSPENNMMGQELLDVLEYVLEDKVTVLTPKEKVVIKHRYGVFNMSTMTLEEVADQFKSHGWRATKEWIFQLQKRALKKIREFYMEWGLMEQPTR